MADDFAAFVETKDGALKIKDGATNVPQYITDIITTPANSDLAYLINTISLVLCGTE
jgi:hypothetical protein